MDADELEELIDRRWTASELVEFLEITVGELINAFPRRINRNLGAILEEIGYEYDDTED